MPTYAHLDANRLTFYGTDGLLYELRSLPLAKRDLFINEWVKFKGMAAGVEDLADFCDRYDRLKPDGTPNPNHDADFRRMTNWLLSYIVAHDPIENSTSKLLDLVDASTVVGLLLSKDGGPSIIEQLEFPQPKADAPKGEPLPDDVDPTAHAMAALVTYCDGDVSKAIDLAQTAPHNELQDILAEHNRLAERAHKKAQGKGKESIWATDEGQPAAPKDEDWDKLSEDDFRAMAEEFKRDQLQIISTAGAINGES
jgi:hypothetical protein